MRLMGGMREMRDRGRRWGTGKKKKGREKTLCLLLCKKKILGLIIIGHIKEDFKLGGYFSHFFKDNLLRGNSILMTLTPSDSEDAKVLAFGSLHGPHAKRDAIVVIKDLGIASINGSNLLHGREPLELIL